MRIFLSFFHRFPRRYRRRLRLFARTAGKRHVNSCRCGALCRERKIAPAFLFRVGFNAHGRGTCAGNSLHNFVNYSARPRKRKEQARKPPGLFHLLHLLLLPPPSPLLPGAELTRRRVSSCKNNRKRRVYYAVVIAVNYFFRAKLRR